MNDTPKGQGTYLYAALCAGRQHAQQLPRCRSAEARVALRVRLRVRDAC